MSVPENPQAPKTYHDFVERFPQLAEAWELVRDTEKKAGFDDKTFRLLKLAVAVGALREGAVRSAARKALAAGVSEREILDVIALATSTLGFPSSVAAFSWVRDVF